MLAQCDWFPLFHSAACQSNWARRCVCLVPTVVVLDRDLLSYQPPSWVTMKVMIPDDRYSTDSYNRRAGLLTLKRGDVFQAAILLSHSKVVPVKRDRNLFVLVIRRTGSNKAFRVLDDRVVACGFCSPCFSAFSECMQTSMCGASFSPTRRNMISAYRYQNRSTSTVFRDQRNRKGQFSAPIYSPCVPRSGPDGIS